MTNFLDRLAGRALGITPVAQPIIPARFNPIAERRGRTEMNDADRTGSSTDDRFSAGTQDTLRLQENEASLPVAAKLREPTLPHTEGEEEVSRQRSILHQPVITEVNSLRHPQGTESSAFPKETGQRWQYQHAADAPAQHIPSEHTPIRREILHTEVPENSTLRDQHILNDMINDRSRSAIARPVHNRVQRPVDLVPEQSSSSTPPVIRVTIGRIDVRAELASPPSSTMPQPKRRSSTLSLDQYLQRQGEAGR